MKNDRLFSGLVLVIIGVVFLLHNFHVIDFHWSNLFRLWPVFLVIGGINLLLANTRAGWATALKVVVLVIGLGFVLFANSHRRDESGSRFNFNFSDDRDRDNDVDTAFTDGDVTSNKGNNNVYQQLYTPDVKTARLNISGGATSYVLNTTTNDLFKASTHETYGNYALRTSKEDTVTVLDFDMKGKNRSFHWDSDRMNEARISLNTAPQWYINLRGGAAETKFDLTPFKIRSLNINGGATSSKIKLAANMPITEVSVSTGASEVEISIPKNAACDITVHSGLSSNDFEGFTKVNGSHYTTPGFEGSANKIYIHLKGGVSDFEVKRY
jgi:hypothetical protein